MRTSTKRLLIGLLALLTLVTCICGTGLAGQRPAIDDGDWDGKTFGERMYYGVTVRWDFSPMTNQSREIYLGSAYSYYVVLTVLPSGWIPCPQWLVPISLSTIDPYKELGDYVLWLHYGLGQVTGFVDPSCTGYYEVQGSSISGCWATLTVYASSPSAPYPF